MRLSWLLPLTLLVCCALASCSRTEQPRMLAQSPEGAAWGGPLTATHKGGLSVALVAIGRRDEGQEVWWRPDGRLLDASPLGGLDFSENLMFANMPESSFVVLLRETRPDTPEHRDPGDGLSYGVLNRSWNLGGRPSLMLSPTDRLRMIQLSVPDEESDPTLDFWIELPTGAFRTVSTTEHVEPDTFDRRPMATWPRDIGGSMALAVTDSYPHGIRAQLKSGRSLEASRATLYSNGRTSISLWEFPNGKADDVLAVDFIYPQYAEFLFQGVSLEPGHRTEPAAEVAE